MLHYMIHHVLIKPIFVPIKTQQLLKTLLKMWLEMSFKNYLFNLKVHHKRAALHLMTAQFGRIFMSLL